MPRTRLAWIVLVVLVAAPGCFRYQTRVPGVIDVRTDGADAEAATDAAPAPEARRTGGSALLLGRGVERRGGAVHVEERRYDLRQAIPLVNASAARELATATATSGALRRVELVEQMTALDVLFAFLAGYLPLGDFFTPSWTFSARGEPIVPPTRSGGAAVPLPRAPPTPFDDPPPPPPAAVGETEAP